MITPRASRLVDPCLNVIVLGHTAGGKGVAAKTSVERHECGHGEVKKCQGQSSQEAHHGTGLGRSILLRFSLPDDRLI